MTAFAGSAGDIDDVIGAEFFGDVEPARHRIETDHAARAARLGHRGAVEAEQTETLDDHRVAQADFGGFGHRCHGGDAAIERRCFLVAQFVGQLEDKGAGQDIAVLGKSTEEVRILGGKVVAVFAHAVTLLRHVEHVAVIALAVEEILAPGDTVADLERVAAHILVDAFAEFLDDADDFMAEDARAGIWPASFVGMNVRAADGRHRHPHQNLAAPGRPHRKFFQDEGRVRRFVNGGLGGAHHAIHSLFDVAARYSTPFSAKSKMS